MKHASLFCILLAMIVMLSCVKEIKHLTPGTMEDILYDYHLAQNMTDYDDADRDYHKHLYYAAVLKKHGVTQADFDSSMVYYLRQT